MTGTVPMPTPQGDAETELPFGLTYKDLARVGIPGLAGFAFGGVPGLAAAAAAGLGVAKAPVKGKTVDVHAFHAAQHVAGVRLSTWHDRVDTTGDAALLENGTVFGLVKVGSVDVSYLSDVETAANMATVTDFLKTVDYPAAFISGQHTVDLPNAAGVDSSGVPSTDHYIIIPGYPGETETIAERQKLVDRRVNDAVTALTGADMHADRAALTDDHPVINRLLAKPESIGVRGYQAGDRYRRILQITGFPREVATAWLADVLDLGVPGSVDVVQRVDPVDNDDLSWLRRKWQVAVAERAVAGDPSRVQTMDQVADDIQDLLQAQTSGEPLLDYTVYVVVSGSSWDVVTESVNQVQQKLQKYRINSRIPWFRTNTAAKVITGLSPDTLGGGHIVSGQGVAAGFPWAATDTVEKGGIVFGRDRVSGRPVVLDRFGWAAPHVAVMGKTGSGKTFFTKLQLLRCSRVYDDLQVLILDLKPGLEYGDVADELNCQVRRWKIGDKTADNPDLLEGALQEAYDAARRHDGRSIVVVDEAHRVLDDPAARLVLDKLVREGRSHRISVMPVTQNTADFTRLDEQGKSMLRQVGCTVFFRHDDVDSQVEEFFRLSDGEVAELHKLRPGQSAGVSDALIRGPLHSTVTIQPNEEQACAVGDPCAAETDRPNSDVLSMPEPDDGGGTEWKLPASLFPNNDDDPVATERETPLVPTATFATLTAGCWGVTGLSAVGILQPGWGFTTFFLGFVPFAFLRFLIDGVPPEYRDSEEGESL